MNKIIAVDFDGTLCENKWPDVGTANDSLFNYLKSQQKRGAKIILWTCRSGIMLDCAVTFCELHGLIFDAINENLQEQIELYGNDSRKICADEYIDDHNSKNFDLPFLA